MRIRRSEAERHVLQDSILFGQQPDVPLFWHSEKVSLRKRNRSTRLVSAEIEVAGLPIQKAIEHLPRNQGCQCPHCTETRKLEIKAVANKWGMGIVRDGSLPPGGFEINTAPAAGDQWVNQITEICDVLRKSGAYATKACGLHIHVDTRDFTYAEIRKLIYLYAFLEPAIMRTQPADRILHGRFARPCGEEYLKNLDSLRIPENPKLWYKEAKKTVNTSVYGESYKEKAPRSQKYHDARYNFLNVHSWYIRGTVECRGHSGTIKKSLVVVWGMIWVNIVDAAYHMSEKEILTIKGQDPQESLLKIATRNCTTKSAEAIERYLRLRWREFEKGYERRVER